MLDIVWDRDDAWQLDKVDDYISGPIQGRVGQNMTGRDRLGKRKVELSTIG